MPESEINKLIAKNINNFLNARNKTQVELADYMGVSQATVSNWCKGIKTPRMDKIDKICKFFNCKCSDLIEERECIMNRLFYPALFHKAEEGGFWISFPDIPECLTQGDNMEDAYDMAIEALGLSLSDMKKNNIPFPTPSSVDNITIDSDAILVVIEYQIS